MRNAVLFVVTAVVVAGAGGVRVAGAGPEEDVDDVRDEGDEEGPKAGKGETETPAAEVVAPVVVEPQADVGVPEGEGQKGKKGKKHKKPKGEGESGGEGGGGGGGEKKDDELVFGGRVFARAEASSEEDAPWTGELKLDSARFGLSYRWKKKLRVKVSVEAAGGVNVKDAYVELVAGHGVTVRAGRFKLPISVIEQASTWTLPTIDRGVVADVLADGVTLSGRREAVEASWTPGRHSPLRLAALLSQSVSITGLDPARPLADGAGVAVTLRGELEVAPGIVLGVHGSNREVNYVKDVRRYWAGGVDAEVDLAEHGLRLWSDVIVGQSHLGVTTQDDPVVGFVAAELAAGWRRGGARKNKRYLEPFVRAAYFNPSWQMRRDDVTDLSLGLAGGRWKRWRLQGQLAVVTVKGLRPAALRGLDRDVNDQLTASVQLGAAF